MNLALYQSQMVHMPSSGYTNKSDDAALYTYYLMIRNLCHSGKAHYLSRSQKLLSILNLEECGVLGVTYIVRRLAWGDG